MHLNVALYINCLSFYSCLEDCFGVGVSENVCMHTWRVHTCITHDISVIHYWCAGRYRTTCVRIHFVPFFVGQSKFHSFWRTVSKHAPEFNLGHQMSWLFPCHENITHLAVSTNIWLSGRCRRRLNVHGSVRHYTNLIEMTNKMQLFLDCSVCFEWHCSSSGAFVKSRNSGIINCPTQLHLVGHFYKIRRKCLYELDSHQTSH